MEQEFKRRLEDNNWQELWDTPTTLGSQPHMKRTGRDEEEELSRKEGDRLDAVRQQQLSYIKGHFPQTGSNWGPRVEPRGEKERI